MTQLRRDPGHIGNWFERLYDGIGFRGSSFSDVDKIDLDAITHDQGPPCHRYLIQEYKHEGEQVGNGQAILLRALAREERVTVFQCELVRDLEHIWWTDLLYPESRALITCEQLRQRYEDWWHDRYHITRYMNISCELVRRRRRYRW
jgi:hypothetical protein